MKRFAVLMLFSLLLLPWTACAENIDKGMEAAIDQLELGELDQLLDSLGEPFASQGLRETLLKIARGEWTLSMDALLKLVGQRFLNVLTGSWWRITRLLAPALAVGICNALGQEKHGAKVAGYGCFLLVAAFMVRDLIDQAKLAADTVERMSGGMQHLFPILLTLLAAVGGSNGSALFQPAVVAAAGTMTTAIHRVVLPLATSSALVSMVDHLEEENRFSRLASLLHTAATWTLGICFTVFLGVIVTQGLGASALDGVTIRTAKYALDNFIPVVGGLFADTVDTLVGGSLLIQNALGTTGLLLILGICLMPLMQTLGTVVLYRGTAAVLQPVAEGRILKCMESYAEALMLLFIVELCAAAMYVLLIAQILAMTNLTVLLR